MMKYFIDIPYNGVPWDHWEWPMKLVLTIGYGIQVMTI